MRALPVAAQVFMVVDPVYEDLRITKGHAA